MNFFKRFRKGRSPGDRRQDPQPTPAEHDLQVVLRDLEGCADPGWVLRGLDQHLERLQEGGHGETVNRLVLWVDEQLGREDGPADRLAQLGSLFQRLEGDRKAHCRRALELYGRALEGYRQAEEREGEAVARSNMGLIFLELGADDSYRQAIPLLEEALSYFEKSQDLTFRGAVCMSLGEAYSRLQEAGPDHLELALEYFEQAWALCERRDPGPEQAAVQGRLGDIQTALAVFSGQETLKKAIHHYGKALEIHAAQGDSEACGRYYRRLGEAYSQLADQDEEAVLKGITAYEQALESFRGGGHKQAVATTCMALADLRWRLKDSREAEQLAVSLELFMEGLRIFEELGLEVERGRALYGLARIFLARGADSEKADLEQALHLLEEAGELFSRASLSREYHLVHEQLRQVRSLLGLRFYY